MAWMKQKEQPETNRPTPTPPASRGVSPTPATPRASRETPAPANIGKSVIIKGEVTGAEDLNLEGKIEGKISLPGHAVSVGKHGRIHGDIQAGSVVVNGTVHGNITASARVEIGATGSVEGDIRAPRIALADGARFKGGVDMEDAGRDAPPKRPPARAAAGNGRPASPEQSAAARAGQN